jgi:flavin reductase (DIM6/NTAB) family NADH-FMN oxidoreductase RutF
VKQRLGPQNRCYPLPVPLVLSGTGNDVSMFAVAWITVAGSNPPAIAMVAGRRHHTVALIRETRAFTVNFAPSRLAREVDYCGLVSGRDHKKAAETGLTLVPSAVVTPPIVDECPYNLECRLVEEIELATGSLMIVGEIVEAHADVEVLTEDGKSADPGKLDPLVYITGTREYYRLGERVADAYSVGRELMGEDG